VAVAIVIAIAVAFWASGLVGVFTRFEKIEIAAAYWNSSGPGGPNVTVIARNTGSTDAAVDMIFVNGRLCDDRRNNPTMIGIGQDTRFYVPVGPACVIQGGVTNEIALHTTSGKTYPVAVLVP